jgi:glycosyltransferase involved in cell wall biosynthesis
MPHANLSLAEAIIVGTPVIAARTEEADEYSLNGKLAKLFEFGNIDAFNQTILDFVVDDKAR